MIILLKEKEKWRHNLVSVLINGRQVSGPFNIRAFFAIVSSDIYVYSIVKVIEDQGNLEKEKKVNSQENSVLASCVCVFSMAYQVKLA